MRQLVQYWLDGSPASNHWRTPVTFALIPPHHHHHHHRHLQSPFYPLFCLLQKMD
ncbi:uncharacterized protein AFUA_2G05660 [Aspergillus fumigatus Af293]|uniref:Uncharacterized protein n=2 Tax=Aspergillus fumigatus TaxID=746128 RepID=Q4WHE8_ASPFU|nr:hypothetical protein AFUA_2G05660 [Aspergillus fumigatus Af293]EAL87657.1 hypothetical protein AFUA_2G05660 [Aspergillus fumigatus Af293]EDP54217.1 hypothetical protein AFUB_022690 [Aspergillus fumigatus A1163]